MSALEIIRGTLNRTATRRRWQAVWRGFWRGFLLAALVWLLALTLYKLLPIPGQTLIWAAGLGLLLCLAGAVRGFWRPPDLLHTARWIDDRHHYQERLSTALEVAQQQPDSRWRDLVVTDAAAAARSFNLRAALPWSLPRGARWCVLLLALTAGLGFVPEYRTPAHRQRQQEAEVIRTTGQQLDQLVKRQLETRPPVLDSTRAALESVEALAQRLGKVELDRNQALKELANATDRIQEQLKELGRDPSLRHLAEASRTGPSGDTRTPEGLQKQIDALQERLGAQAENAEALSQLKQRMENLQHAAAGLPQTQGGAAEALRAEMAQSMADLAKQAEEMGVDVAGLQAAMQALADGNVSQMARDLDAAFLDLDKIAQMAKAMQDLQQQLADLGKDLAEQLEKAQGIAAYATLKKMIRELEGAGLPPEALDQMLQEVTAAVAPGSQYGQVGEFLKQAAQQLREGQRPGAAESLAQAADEIKRLMEQAADSDGLMAAMAGLQMGQMAIGNNMAWGLCQGLGSRPGMGPGGRPGAGVGTWADENLWMDPENTGRWDNSGVTRPDQDSRGLTDRGEPGSNDALIPTKVRGQMSPGGPMPSITLRGVSIRGQSQVDYQERVTAAQSEAQSALNQDQVPRVYRGAVRDYFNDLN